MRPDSAAERFAAQPLAGGPPHGSPSEGAQLARELRRALDDLNSTSEDASELVCIVEDSFGLDYPSTDGERPTAAEQDKAKAALPGALGELAKLENQLRKQLWFMARARRGLAKMVRAGQGNLPK